MSEFLIKSSVTMAVLLGLYYLLFEREKMHRFNRFYLLSALAFSLTLPFITVIIYVDYIARVPVIPAYITVLPTEETVNYWPYAGWLLYALITIIMLVRFVKNVIPLIRKASNNPSVKMGTTTVVLLEEKVLPHTFLNYVFVNREEHENRMIEEELYTHELTHVRQRHTLDILFIEALKTIFWFNPLLYFYKKAIQLNHEFLADEKVIDTTANTFYYQNLLLERASVGTTFSMASNLNFSLTKKRLLMMTKTTSTVKAGSLKIAIAPVVAALMMLLCTKAVPQEAPKTASAKQDKATTFKVSKVKPDSPQKVKQEKMKETKSVTNKKPGLPSQSKKMKKESTADSENFSSKNSYTLKLGGEIKPESTRTYNLSGPISTDPSRIKSIDMKPLTQTEIDALKKFDPVTYNDTTLKDYVAMHTTYLNDEGQLEERTTFEKRPKNN